MPKEEAVVRIVEKISKICTGLVDSMAIREAIEEVLYDYDLTPAQRALVIQDNMEEKILLYLASRKIDGLSERTLESYQRYLGKFALVVRKNVEDITTLKAQPGNLSP